LSQLRTTPAVFPLTDEVPNIPAKSALAKGIRGSSGFVTDTSAFWFTLGSDLVMGEREAPLEELTGAVGEQCC
jgi:hypothetical protein